MNIFYSPADKGGSGYYRMYLPAKHMRAQGHDTAYKYEASTNSLEVNMADVLVLQRQVDPQLLPFIRWAKSKGKIVISELDDNKWHIPEGNLSKKYWTREYLRMLENVLAESTAVTVSTDPLRDVVRKFNKNTWVMPNYIEPPSKISPERIDRPYKVRIGWAGSDSHIPDFDSDIIQALLTLKRKYGSTLDIVMLGGYFPEELAGMVSVYPFVKPIQYIDYLEGFQFDIGIIPCKSNPFNTCKSNLKFLEYSAVGAVTVASPVYPYSRTIKDGETGFVLKQSRFKEWVRILTMLVEDASLRKTVAQNAKQFVTANYMIADQIGKIDDIYKGITKL